MLRLWWMQSMPSLPSFLMFYSHIIHIHIQHNKDKWTQLFRKIYVSLSLKGFERVTKGCIVWEVSWRLNRTVTYWPHAYDHNSVSFLSSWAAQLGAWRPSLSGTWSSFQHHLSNWSELQLLDRVLVLSPLSYLQLIRTSCRRGYIIIWRPLFFLWASQFRSQFNPSTVKVISWYSSTGCTCYLHRCNSLFWQLGRRQYKTLSPFWHERVAPDSVLSMGQIKLNCLLTLNWIVRNSIVLTFIVV